MHPCYPRVTCRARVVLGRRLGVGQATPTYGEVVSLNGLLAALVQVVLTVTAVPVPVVAEAVRVVAPPSVDGTQAEAATGFGSVPPPWMGTRVLPEDPATGHGEVRPTPPV